MHVLNYHTFLFIMFEFNIFYAWVVTKVCCSLQVFHHLVVKGKVFLNLILMQASTHYYCAVATGTHGVS
jgi:hypothetical protein